MSDRARKKLWQGIYKHLPHSLETEQALLGAILLDDSRFDAAAEALGNAEFSRDAHEEIWWAMRSLREKGSAIDPTLVLQELDDDAREVVGGAPTIDGLTEGVPRFANVEHYARAIREQHARRSLVFLGQELVEDALADKSDAAVIVEKYRPSLDALGVNGKGIPAARSLEEIVSDPDALRVAETVVPRLGFRERIVMLAAREKAGKSTLARVGSAKLSTGGSFLGERIEPGVVLYMALEEHLADVARSFETFEACRSSVYIIDRLGDPFSTLEGAVETVDPDLVVIDTLAAFVEALEPESGSSAQWTPIMQRLARLAHDSGPAVLLLHHGRKEGKGYRDSTAIGANVDVILEMTTGSDAQVRKVHAQGRWHIDDYTFRLVNSDPPRLELAGGEVTTDARVLLYLQSNPGASTREVRSGVTGRAAEIDETLDRLEARGAVEMRREGSAKRWYLAETPSEGPGRGRTRSGHAPDTVSDDQGEQVCPEQGETRRVSRSDTPPMPSADAVGDEVEFMEERADA